MKQEIVFAIDGERGYQEAKWPGHKHNVAEWLLIMRKCLDDAQRAWVCGHGDDQALHEIRQVVAVGVAAMEQCGAPLRDLGAQRGAERPALLSDDLMDEWLRKLEKPVCFLDILPGL